MKAGNKKPLVVLQPRDLRLLQIIGGTLRIVDYPQALVAGRFGSITRVRARLLLLALAGFLRQQFIGTIVGGRKAVFTLTRQGAERIGIDAESLRRPVDRLRDGELYFRHQLGLNDIYLAARFPKTPVGEYRLTSWTGLFQTVAPNIPLIPDAYGEFDYRGDIKPCFIEADLGTETRSIWKKKIELYKSYALSGEFERRYHRPRFQVLVVTTSKTRVGNLRELTSSITDKLFWFSTFAEIHKGFTGERLWLRPLGDEPVSIF